jgi:hypothetical protein
VASAAKAAAERAAPLAAHVVMAPAQAQDSADHAAKAEASAVGNVMTTGHASTIAQPCHLA